MQTNPNVFKYDQSHQSTNLNSRRKHATSVKRGKTSNQRQARENMQLAPSAGKHATSAKRGNTYTRCTYNQCQALETRKTSQNWFWS